MPNKTEPKTKQQTNKVKITIELSEDRAEKLDILCKLDHDSTRKLYCEKLINKHLANRRLR